MADWWNVFSVIAVLSVFGWAAWMAANDQASHIEEARILIKYWPGGWLAFIVLLCIANVFHVDRLRRRRENAETFRRAFPTAEADPDQMDSFIRSATRFNETVRRNRRDPLTPMREDKEREKLIDEILKRGDFE